jgi:AhpD family alkylhydroperoxidase
MKGMTMSTTSLNRAASAESQDGTPGPRLPYQTFKDSNPDIYTALATLSAKASEGLEKDLVELVKLRASQINGCAFCLQYHLTLARGAKVPAAKLDLLAAWRDAGLFSPRERAALAWAETLTKLSTTTVSDADYQAVRREFTEQEVAHLTTAIGAINIWNRISTAFAFAPILSTT